MEQNKKRNLSDGTNPFISALIGGGISLAVMLLTAFVFPLALLRFSNPNAVSAPMAYICVFIGAATGSFIAAKRSNDSAIQAGLMSGGVMLLPMILVSLIIPGGGSFISAFAVIAVIMVASLLGSYIVMKLGTSRKRNMKKAMKRR